MTKQPKTYRQGDVMLQEVSHTLTGNEPILPREGQRIVLAHGEATGHAHSIMAPFVKFLDLQGIPAVHSEEAFTITHEEHAPVAVPPGVYHVIRQREYSPESIRNVAD